MPFSFAYPVLKLIFVKPSEINYTSKISYSFGLIMSFEDQVRSLTLTNVNEIETHYYAALETEHGSGDHWILMTVLDKYGFRTNSPTAAMQVADQIIVLWYTLNRQQGT